MSGRAVSCMSMTRQVPVPYNENGDTPDGLIRRYVKASRLILQLQGALAFERPEGRQEEYASEARARVEQMTLALRRSNTLQHRYRTFQASLTGRKFVAVDAEVRRLRRRRGRIAVALGFYAEAFYYLAHRATKCLQKLDDFKSFGPRGTRDVRNHLIEHPERGGFVALHRNYRYDQPQGVRLKPFRRDGDSRAHQDAGLYLNADEFVTHLLEYIARAETSHPERAERREADTRLRKQVAAASERRN
jgi:hypothetical protein